MSAEKITDRESKNVSGQEQKDNQTERERIRSLLLPEIEREKQDAYLPVRMNPENHTINTQLVTFVGASHIFSKDLTEEEKSRLKTELNDSLDEFARASEGEKTVYIVEGSIPKDEDLQGDDDEKNITIKAARKEGAEYLSGDPEPAVLYETIQESQEFIDLKEIEVEGLGKFNSGDLSLLYFFFRDCNLSNGPDDKNMVTIFNIIDNFNDFTFFKASDLKQYLKSYPDSISKEDLLTHAIPLAQDIISQLQVISEYFKDKYSDQGMQELVEDYDSSQDSEAEPNLRSGINYIATNVRRERDVYLLEQIQEQTKAGNNVIVVWGASHQTRTRRVLEAMSQNG